MSSENKSSENKRSLEARLAGGVFGLDRIALCTEAAQELVRLRAALELVASKVTPQPEGASLEVNTPELRRFVCSILQGASVEEASTKALEPVGVRHPIDVGDLQGHESGVVALVRTARLQSWGPAWSEPFSCALYLQQDRKGRLVGVTTQDIDWAEFNPYTDSESCAEGGLLLQAEDYLLHILELPVS